MRYIKTSTPQHSFISHRLISILQVLSYHGFVNKKVLSSTRQISSTDKYHGKVLPLNFDYFDKKVQVFWVVVNIYLESYRLFMKLTVVIINIYMCMLMMYKMSYVRRAFLSMLVLKEIRRKVLLLPSIITTDACGCCICLLAVFCSCDADVLVVCTRLLLEHE